MLFRSLREVLTVVPAVDGALCVRDSAGDFWAACVYIPDTVTYDRADSIELARMGGVGIGRFQAQLADFHEPLHETIRGFHDIRHRFVQWDEALKADRAGRCATVAAEIAGIEARRAEMLAFRRLVDDGVIQTLFISKCHGSGTNPLVCACWKGWHMASRMCPPSI